MVDLFLTEPGVAVTVFASATVEASVVEKTPEALVVPTLEPKVLPVPVSDRLKDAPERTRDIEMPFFEPGPSRRRLTSMHHTQPP